MFLFVPFNAFTKQESQTGLQFNSIRSDVFLFAFTETDRQRYFADDGDAFRSESTNKIEVNSRYEDSHQARKHIGTIAKYRIIHVNPFECETIIKLWYEVVIEISKYFLC